MELCQGLHPHHMSRNCMGKYLQLGLQKHVVVISPVPWDLELTDHKTRIFFFCVDIVMNQVVHKWWLKSNMQCWILNRRWTATVSMVRSNISGWVWDIPAPSGASTLSCGRKGCLPRRNASIWSPARCLLDQSTRLVTAWKGDRNTWPFSLIKHSF